MPTLDDLRAQGEAGLEEILAGLDAKYRQALKAAVEYYGRVEDIPEIFWVEMEQDIEREQLAALALLILAADEWTGDEIERQGASIVSTSDRSRATRLAQDQLRKTTSQTVDTLRKRLANKVRDARTTGPGDLGELTKRGLQRAVNDVLTPERRQGIATDETTKAFSAGQKAARDRLGGDGAITDTGQRVTIELYWVTERDNKVCPKCKPYHDTPESVWGQAFPEGPGPQVHPNCRCSLRPVVVVQRDVQESTDDGEGRWITIRGNAVRISDDGEILTGPLKGQNLSELGDSGGESKDSGETQSKSDTADSTNPPKHAARFAVGQSLTPTQKAEVIKSMGDVYKDNNLDMDRLVSHTKNDEPIYGYPIRPDLFVRSDITGKPVRHYVILPDGRKAHPSEVYGHSMNKEINKAIKQGEIDNFNRQLRIKTLTRDKLARVATDKNAANYNYIKTRRQKDNSFFAQHEDGRIARVDANDPEDVEMYQALGFKKQDT